MMRDVLYEYAKSLGLDVLNDKWGLLLVKESWYIFHLNSSYPFIYFPRLFGHDPVAFTLSDPNIIETLKSVIKGYIEQIKQRDAEYD